MILELNLFLRNTSIEFQVVTLLLRLFIKEYLRIRRCKSVCLSMFSIQPYLP